MRTSLILGVLVSVSFTPACSGQAVGDADDRIAVVTSFYPLRFVAERIGGDCVSVRDLTPPGVEPHDLELTPDAVEAIATADVVLYLGGGFQPAIEDAVGEAGGQVIDLLDGVATLPAPAGEVKEGLTVDPHVWLDPSRLGGVVAETARALEDAGIPSSCDVSSSVESIGSDLAALDEAFRAGLAGCADDLIVTTHEAFGYLADAYGLRQEAIAGLEPEVEPNPKRLAEIVSLVEREGVTTIFSEELGSPDVAETLAAEAGVDTAVLFTIEGLTDEEVAAGKDYFSLMEENLDALRSALRCP